MSLFYRIDTTYCAFYLRDLKKRKWRTGERALYLLNFLHSSETCIMQKIFSNIYKLHWVPEKYVWIFIQK